MSRILLGVSGGIAAYKACVLLRRFVESGHDVVVVPTENALKFVGAATWEALSGNPVYTSVFEDVSTVPHVRLGQTADLVVVAPATADLLSRAATGRADDLLTNVLLTARCPVMMAPAMHTEMWRHLATVANVATLRSRGVVVMDPADGRLTGADSGPGRLPEPDDIAAAALTLLDAECATSARSRDLDGVRVAVSAGGTREWIDPVRTIGNLSSGRQGVALARAAALRGADVTLVAAHLETELPSGAEIVRVQTTEDLARAMGEVAPSVDVVIMAAAPADFTPADPSEHKMKKQGDASVTLTLRQTTDVLAGLSASKKPTQTIVGFAAETAPDHDELVALGQAKLARKGCDLLVLNNVAAGAVFGQASNAVTIIDGNGVLSTSVADKNIVAHRILDAVVAKRGA